MYNSKRFETVKNMRENKKISNAVQAAIGVLAVVLAALIVWMMVLVSGIQGTARVVNYAGLVRGKTQRLVKMEIAGQAEDGMMESVESFINGLRFGDDELTLVRLDDKSFQTKMEELASCFESLKQEIYLVREKGFEKTDIIDKSEKFFDICDSDIGSAAIMRGYMARPCDVYFTLERKLERFLQLTLRIYCVPEEKQREVMALIASLDIRAIANEVMQKLFAALEMHYEFTLGEEAKQI